MKQILLNKKYCQYIGKPMLVLFLMHGQIIMTAQALAVQWNKSIGGSSEDVLFSLLLTADGGYILGGYSWSNISGDKTESSKGSNDYWVVKLDFAGNKIWDKTIGGNGNDALMSLQPTADGGYILSGSSSSNISGDKTENSKGFTDFWLVKLDAAGNKVWDKTIGGSSDDILNSAFPTSDGGYILGGYSNSNISGDKTENSRGFYDYWVVKLDAAGNKVWDKTIGASMFDLLYSVRPTADGAYILGGWTPSNISGDKTENSEGGFDYWIVKLDAAGNKIWDKTIGGSGDDYLYSLEATADGEYILGGYSGSNISGDKTEDSKGAGDYWVVKLDAAGNKIWDKTIGGSDDDFLWSLYLTGDGGYILHGDSSSNISGDKTENSKGLYDYWMVKLDADGNKAWDKTIGGSDDDFLYSLYQTVDGNYILGGYSSSNISGDKTENSEGFYDYWVVKLVGENICSVSSLTATIPDSYAITYGVSPNTVYIGYQPASSITLTASSSGGNAPYSYNWSTSPLQTTQQITVSPTTTSTYTCTVTDATGCAASSTKTITVVDIRTPGKPGKVNICHRDLKGKWTTLSVLASSVAEHLAHGDYLGNCPTPPPVEVGSAAKQATSNEARAKEFKIYPNPASDFIDVHWTTTNTSQSTIRILNAEGRVVKTLTTKGAVNNQRISLNGLAKGIYMLVLKTGSDQQVTKFVIQ